MFFDLTVCLASASPRRAALLRQLGVSFYVRPADIDERRQAGEPPRDYVIRIARAKASAAASSEDPSTIVIGADTAIEIDGEILGKPAGRDAQHEMLRRLSDRAHHVLSAVCVMRAGHARDALSSTEVSFKMLGSHEIERYLACEEGLDKAGGYAIQGYAAAFVTRLCGSYSGVVGLPLYETMQLLDRFADG